MLPNAVRAETASDVFGSFRSPFTLTLPKTVWVVNLYEPAGTLPRMLPVTVANDKVVGARFSDTSTLPLVLVAVTSECAALTLPLALAVTFPLIVLNDRPTG